MVGSDNSSRLIFEKLPKKEIHGQVPQISNCNRQALSQFEAQARKGEPPAQNGRKSAQLTPVNKIINDLKSNLNSLLVSIFFRKFYSINSMTYKPHICFVMFVVVLDKFLRDSVKRKLHVHDIPLVKYVISD